MKSYQGKRHFQIGMSQQTINFFKEKILNHSISLRPLSNHSMSFFFYLLIPWVYPHYQVDPLISSFFFTELVYKITNIILKKNNLFIFLKSLLLVATLLLMGVVLMATPSLRRWPRATPLLVGVALCQRRMAANHPFQCSGVCEPPLVSRVSRMPSPMFVEVVMSHPFANGGGCKPPPSHIGMP